MFERKYISSKPSLLVSMLDFGGVTSFELMWLFHVFCISIIWKIYSGVILKQKTFLYRWMTLPENSGYSWKRSASHVELSLNPSNNHWVEVQLAVVRFFNVASKVHSKWPYCLHVRYLSTVFALISTYIYRLYLFVYIYIYALHKYPPKVLYPKILGPEDSPQTIICFGIKS